MLTLIRNVAGVFLCPLLLLACMLLSSQQASAAGGQNRILSGQVRDQAQVGLPGVVVMIKGLGKATTTNASGSFVLDCEEAAPVLVLQCAGYQTQNLPVEPNGTLTITMYKVGVTPLVVPEGTATLGEATGVADVAPAFPGGAEAYRAYLKQHFHYPEEAKKEHTSCSVVVGFVVDEAGRILEAEVLKGCAAGLNEEALRLVRLMPWWTPARRAGQPVRVKSSLRIRFELQ